MRAAIILQDHTSGAGESRVSRVRPNGRTLNLQWESGDNVSTEDLRLALQRYRSFFDRLLKL